MSWVARPILRRCESGERDMICCGISFHTTKALETLTFLRERKIGDEK